MADRVTRRTVATAHRLRLFGMCMYAAGAICAAMLMPGRANAAADVAYIDQSGKLTVVCDTFAFDPRSALAELGCPAKDVSGNQLSSAVPSGTRVIVIRTAGDSATVNFSREIIGAGLSEARLRTIFDQVRFTLHQFKLDGNVSILVEDRPISEYLPPIKKPSVKIRPVVKKIRQAGALSGHTMTLSPGHGLYWTGAKWTTQRGVYGAPLNEEDYHNLEMSQYLETYLKNDGMAVNMVRCADKNYGDYSAGTPWWKMAAPYWLRSAGYPPSVYGPLNTTLGGSDSDISNDICSRPLASNYDDTDIYVSLHTNGFRGDTYAVDPSGTEIYYDGSSSHAEWADQSKDLATKIGNAVIQKLEINYDSTWTSHSALVKDSNGNYGEIRIPKRPAVLLELGYHDTCNRDAVYLRDNFFRSAAMWGVYEGICSYFGRTPTWGFYSCEYVSDNIPTQMIGGKQYQVSITLRNRGVVWTEAKQIDHWPIIGY